jgi:Tol biopolymer transport system component
MKSSAKSTTPSGSAQQLKSITPVRPGQQLVFGVHGDGYSLYAMDPAGSKLTRLTDGVSPVWSPDGKQIAYTRYLKEPNPAASSAAPSSATPAPFTETLYIFVMNTDGSGARQLLNKAAVEPAWSPEGNDLAFTLYEGKTYKGANYVYCGIYIVDADGSGTPRKLATGPGCASFPRLFARRKEDSLHKRSGLGRVRGEYHVRRICRQRPRRGGWYRPTAGPRPPCFWGGR